MSCYINEMDVFAVILNTTLDIKKFSNGDNVYERSYFMDFFNNNKLNEDVIKIKLLGCYKEQVKSYVELYKENIEKINFIEEISVIEESYYRNNNRKYCNIMLIKAIQCMLYQIETKYNKIFWEGLITALLKDTVFCSKEYEAATWGFGKVKELKPTETYFLSYMDPEGDDDKFGIMANSPNRSELVDFIRDDLEIHYPDGELKEEIEEFLAGICASEEEFEIELGRTHHYKITKEIVK